MRLDLAGSGAAAAAPGSPRARGGAFRADAPVRVLGLARANNCAIMLAAFADVPGGTAGLRATLLTGVPALGTERLALLLQVRSARVRLVCPDSACFSAHLLGAPELLASGFWRDLQLGIAWCAFARTDKGSNRTPREFHLPGPSVTCGANVADNAE